jgi:ribonuclease-3 family protein
VEYVNAAAQASFLEMILPETDEREQEIIRRGRNAHARHPAPKNQELGDYSAATGFEALIGFLYITGREDRILQFAGMIIGGNGDG